MFEIQAHSTVFEVYLRYKLTAEAPPAAVNGEPLDGGEGGGETAGGGNRPDQRLCSDRAPSKGIGEEAGERAGDHAADPTR